MNSAACELVSPRGTVGVERYAVTEAHCVQRAGEGDVWTRKPHVMASVELIRVAEDACMRQIHRGIPVTSCALGSAQQLTHHAPVAIGAQIDVMVHCDLARGGMSRWQIEITDEGHRVASGMMTFVVVDLAEYERRRAERARHRRRAAAGVSSDGVGVRPNATTGA